MTAHRRDAVAALLLLVLVVPPPVLCHPKWLVVGINTVPRRNDADYLMKSLLALNDQIAGSVYEASVTVIVVNHAAGRHKVFSEAKAHFTGAKNFVFAESSTPLPDPTPNAPDLHNENVPNAAVRRQSLDLVRSIEYYVNLVATQKAAHFMFMEDDMQLCMHGLRAIHHAIEKANSYTDWSVLRVSYGMNGLIFQSRDLQPFGDYLRDRLTERPPDHLVVEWFASETARSKAHFRGRPNMAFRHNLFAHLGMISSIGKELRQTPQCFSQLGDLMVDVERFDSQACGDDDISPCSMRPGKPKLVEWTRMCSHSMAVGASPSTVAVLDSAVQPMAGAQGESCDAVCSRHGKLCRADQLRAVNSCEQIRKVFPCEKGCSMHFGPEQPCYVSDINAPEMNLPRTCLVNSNIETATCAASHHMTSRICPCT